METDKDDQLRTVYCPRQTVIRPQFNIATKIYEDKESTIAWTSLHEDEKGARKTLEDLQQQGYQGSLHPAKEYKNLSSKVMNIFNATITN
ncbi:hypothetical protein HOK51_02590 [Candidatus Woesearchaeota archaeon]|jgi:hypothetical protein|nr:hypothetical protein [Candidatus Woesearchaeota archaeon]MBT6518706.1 hypothetical protein [Candidatus Woesearchaeota archaeon]MBT7368372.1 hypothetical protein [Candidatus Woesearchaeota archaeon]